MPFFNDDLVFHSKIVHLILYGRISNRTGDCVQDATPLERDPDHPLHHHHCPRLLRQLRHRLGQSHQQGKRLFLQTLISMLYIDCTVYTYVYVEEPENVQPSRRLSL